MPQFEHRRRDRRRTRAPVLALFLAAGLAAPPGMVADPARLVVLDGTDLGPWEERGFSGNTRYEAVEVDGRRAVRAESAGTASGLFREIAVDLEKTPVMHWTWRVDNTLGDIDEKTRGGDDYPARIYAVSTSKLMFWRTRAVNYVWSSRRPVGEIWPNAYTDRTRMVAVRSGDGEIGRWVSESRDVRADFERLFGADVKRIDAVAIMTDTDDSGGRAVAYYGDVWFSER